MRNRKPPIVTTQCVDCGLGTMTAHEWYMVKDAVWELAWVDRRKSWYDKAPGAQVLCVGCLEARLGRQLTREDFTGAPCNNPHRGHAMSARWRARLGAKPAIKMD
jgi:hypothetical protein